MSEVTSVHDAMVQQVTDYRLLDETLSLLCMVQCSCNSTILNIGTRIKLIVSFTKLPISLLGDNPPLYPVYRRPNRPQNRPVHMKKRNISCSFKETNPDFSKVESVA